ncbi:GlmU family protein [Gangjinia marincola]|uniref:GlmU family protein n=1 Tax=Gangjinia marincola TaxID=578463 RepID=A0ABP3XRT3_9FLAO
MNYILFDGPYRNNLLPFTFTRPVADLRIGITTIREKWEYYLGKVSTKTEEYLQQKWPLETKEKNCFVHAAVLPSEELISKVRTLTHHQVLLVGDEVIAFSAERFTEDYSNFEKIELTKEAFTVKHTWDIFSKNGDAIKDDFNRLTAGRLSQVIPDYIHARNPEHIFIEHGAQVNVCVLNAEDGPIYIGKDALIMDGSTIKGPFALGEHGVVKMGAKIYGPTTAGPYCKIGGEINNSVLFGYSSKGHDGFMGNSVIGEWCNWGADTNNSNLKNNYAEVRLWNYEKKGFDRTGLQFCGLMMGDHSKCGINTMFNTGTVVGVSANIYGGGFPRNFIPSFSWGGASGMTTYRTNKAFETAEKVMERRDLSFGDDEKAILSHVFELTKEWRKD